MLENLLRETANIRSNDIPYFQIFIIPEKLPYYKNGGKIEKWEKFTQHNVDKYLVLSEDKTDVLLHSPTKTLLQVIKFFKIPNKAINKNEYISFYKENNYKLENSKKDYGEFSSNVVYNNYTTFIEKLIYRIKSI